MPGTVLQQGISAAPAPILGVRSAVSLRSVADPTRSLTLTAATELMPQWIPAQVMDPRDRFGAVLGQSGQPLLFSIGTSAAGPRFLVTLYESGSRSGWAEFDLGLGLPQGYEPDCFDVAQAPDGGVRLVVALRDPAAKHTRVFVANLPPSEASFAWEPGRVLLAPKPSADAERTEVVVPPPEAPWSGWEERTLPGLDIVSDIVLSASDGSPFAFVAAQKRDGVGLDTWCLRLDGSADAAWAFFPLPENATEILDLSGGMVEGKPGLFGLYRVGPDTSLEFTTLPSGDAAAESFAYPLPTGVEVTSLDVIAGPAGASAHDNPLCRDCGGSSDDLYLAGEGLFLYASGRTVEPTRLADASALPVKKANYLERDDTDGPWRISDEHRGRSLVVRGSAERVTVWAICGDGRLFYLEGPGSTGVVNWSSPALIDPDVAQIAPLWNAPLGANQVFCLDGKADKLTYRWQDPGSSLWRDGVIALPHPGEVVRLDGYTVQISLSGADGKAGVVTDPPSDAPMPEGSSGRPQVTVVGPMVSLWASEWVYVYVNGRAHSIGPHATASLLPDPLGRLTVVMPTKSISAPLLHLSVDGYEGADGQSGVVDCNPAAVALARLQASSFESFQAIGGTPDASEAELRAQHQALQHMGTTCGNTASPGLSTSAASLRPSGVEQPGALGTFGADQSWAVSINPEKNIYTVRTGEEATQLGIKIGGAILGVAGAILQELGNAVQQGVDEVTMVLHALEDIPGVRLVVQIAEVAFEVVGTTLSVLMEAFCAALDALGYGLAKLLLWLGVLPPMEEVLAAQRFLVNAVEQFLWLARDELETIREKVDEAFEQFEDVVGQALNVPPELLQRPPGGDAGSDALGTGFMSVIHGLGSVVSPLLGPLSSFPGTHVMHSGILETNRDHLRLPGEGSSLAGYIQDGVERLVAGLATDLVETVTGTIQGVAADIVRLAAGEISVPVFLESLVGIATVELLELVRKIVDLVLTLIEQDVLPALQDLLESSMDVPFLTGFYRGLTDQEDFTLLKGMALLLALPAVGICTLAGVSSPFRGSMTDLESAKGRYFLNLISGSPEAPPPLSGGLPGTALPPVTPPSPKPGEPTASQVQYSDVGGIFNALALLVDVILLEIGAIRSFVEEKKQAPTPLGGVDVALEVIGFVAALVQFVVSYPIGADSQPIRIKRWSWGITIIPLIVTFIIMVLTMVAVKKRVGMLEFDSIGLDTIGTWIDAILTLIELILNIMANAVELTNLPSGADHADIDTVLAQDFMIQGGFLASDAQAIGYALGGGKDPVVRVVLLIVGMAGGVLVFIGDVLAWKLAVASLQNKTVDQLR